ncbi:DegT/DnrJ/EryC1/StrS family aminotransferase [Streptomyces sp. URMC 127]|uniref:DegT/DnrJ/EryC1/StrS family aminotransferase n=1 Tax=Streptomyces sp. URMC 127 TaxID=3423402 RepID=UPI003F1B297B
MTDPARTVTLPFPKESGRYRTAEQPVIEQLRTGRLSDTGRGPAVTELEDAFAALAGTRYALSFNSGTAALHAALHAIGASPAAGIATTPMTWISAITATFHAGSFPVFCDIEPDTPNLDPHALAALAPACSAALVAHAFGVPARMDALTTAAPLPLVEDCSHAHGALYRHRPVGSWGAAGCFSLQDSKTVSGGEGGILTTSDRAVYEHALVLGHHPHRLQVELTLDHLRPLVGTGGAYKFRMPPLSAVIAREQLRTLAARSQAAEDNLTVLREALHELQAPVTWPTLADGSRRGWYGTPVTITHRVRAPQALAHAATTAGVPLRPLYEDWLHSPLLQDRQHLERLWPHIAATDYRPPDAEAFPHYTAARRQMLIIKIPTRRAADYMHQVATVLSDLLAHHTR